MRTMGQAQRLADDLKKASRLSEVLQFGVGVPLVLKPVEYMVEPSSCLFFDFFGL